MNSSRVAIVIPAYKEHLNRVDEISLESLHRVMGDKYDIILASWEKKDAHPFDDSEYRGILGDVKNRYFDESWFADTVSYSHMLEKDWFYSAFSDYEYILLYQTDCYLFSDDLEYWCDKGYDYIGAPIVSNHYVWKTAPTTGNGGFSLRKVSTFIDICGHDFFKEYPNIFTDPKIKDIEDLYFCQYVYQVYDYKKPRVNEAGFFSIDMNPDIVLRNNKYVLPMGMHTWDKNIHYWKHIVSELADDDIVKFCDEKWENERKTGVGLYYKMMKEKYVDDDSITGKVLDSPYVGRDNGYIKR